jgi:hypothetical protein
MTASIIPALSSGAEQQAYEPNSCTMKGAAGGLNYADLGCLSDCAKRHLQSLSVIEIGAQRSQTTAGRAGAR